MEKCKINFKKLLGTLCILIVIIMIIRFLYIRLNNNNKNNNNKIEGFDNGAIDLLSKVKSNTIVSNTTFELATVINSWTTKIYNMKSPNTQTKQIALYQPILLINSVQYCKLGDMLSQNKNYAPPIVNQNTLLIKSNSDIKPPIDYELVVNFGEEYVNTKYYKYESFINNIDTMNLIKPSINICANIVRDINNLIKNIISSSSPDILKTSTLHHNNYKNSISLSNLYNKGFSKIITVPMDDYLIPNRYYNNYPFEFDKKLNYTYNRIVNGVTNEIPAGVSGTFNYDYYKDFENVAVATYSFQIPFTVPIGIDGSTPDECVDIFNTANPILVSGAYPLQSKITSNNFSAAKTPSTPVFTLVPIMQTLDYLTLLCNQINIIYENNNTNVPFLTFLQLVNNKETIINILDKIELCKDFISAYDNINTITVKDNPDIAPSFSAIYTAGIASGTTTLIGKLFEFMRDAKTSYTPSTFRIYGDQLPTVSKFENVEKIGLIKYTSISYSPFIITETTKYTNNSFNILSDKYNIQPVINNLIDFNKFIIDLQNNNIKNLPLKIYKPIPPPGYVSIGHVFCNIQLQLKNIKENATSRTGICCIPDNCIKEMKDWNISDKVFEYSKDDVYWAIYYNKYTGTFVSTNKNQLPTGKMYKVIACVTKCTAVEELQKSDKCARNYYNINKSLSNEAKSPADLVSDQEEEYYLAKLKAQSDNLTRLSNRAHQMELDIDKANIVNREMNKNKLHSYVDKQKVNIDLILQRLIKDKDSIQTNINIPQSLLDKLLDMIKNLKDMSDDDKLKLISKLLNKSCPNPNLAGLVKKQLVSDVCYGCDNV